MSLSHLDALFRPKSITVVGASNRPRSIGSVVIKNLLHENFSGPILPVNPKYTAVGGILAYPSVSELPLSPDLAIVCTPPETVPDYIQALGRKKAGAVLIMSTDLEQLRDESTGLNYRDLSLKHARDFSMRILGPDCLGLIIPRSGLNASFAHTSVLKGEIAFVSQSDSLGIAVLDWAKDRGIGFSHFISLGDYADIDFADVLDYLGGDPYTSSILLYIEDIRNARKFISAARSASRNKPVVVIKSGQLEETIQPSTLPAGTPVEWDDIFDALFRRAGMLRVYNVAELFDSVETLARAKPLRGDRLAILSNGRGPAVMAMEILLKQGGHLAPLTEKTTAKLGSDLENEFTGTNPIRLKDRAASEAYAQALESLIKDENVDAVLVIHIPTAFTSSEDIAGAVVNAIGRSRKNIFTVWLGEKETAQARRIFALAGVPTYETPDQATQIFMDMVRYRRNQEMLMQTPDSIPKEFTPNPDTARAIINNALAENRSRLNQAETNEILSEYRIPVVETRIVENAEEAALMAREIGFPVALKVLSSELRSKYQAGGVAMDLESEEDIIKAARAMTLRIETNNPDIKLEGFIVQKMARRPGAQELLLGMTSTPDLGPVILFGQGGPAARVIRDQSVGLPPLNMSLANEIIQQTRIAKILKGFQGQPGVDVKSIRLTLVQLSQLTIDLPEIKSLSINPLLADVSGVMVLDARIVVQKSAGADQLRLAIQPYPEHLEEEVSLKSGEKILLRPIRPEDEHSHAEFINSLSQEDIRMRFFGIVHTFSHSQLARYTQIDYAREMAFVATSGSQGRLKTLGVVRTYFDPDNTFGEFAIVVRSDQKSQGLGTILMDKMIRYCRDRGTGELMAYTLRENRGMQALAKKIGFTVRASKDDPETVELRLRLRED
ncbi:MAG: bifunctional acetate--CoA ligase family protein/GNAT family N-acetyltransferase [Desulfohalobiaceae bacterium]|nr:bifunctional acetate--CoA ligase family protein/GNAT family N-acetyltransferase [Desulfohalobiaceae bacterium]